MAYLCLLRIRLDPVSIDFSMRPVEQLLDAAAVTFPEELISRAIGILQEVSSSA